jgi:hypothetical protein
MKDTAMAKGRGTPLPGAIHRNAGIASAMYPAVRGPGCEGHEQGEDQGDDRVGAQGLRCGDVELGREVGVEVDVPDVRGAGHREREQDQLDDGRPLLDEPAERAGRRGAGAHILGELRRLGQAGAEEEDGEGQGQRQQERDAPAPLRHGRASDGGADEGGEAARSSGSDRDAGRVEGPEESP